jgi:predicted MPP superfamily phosphohydrolase
LVRRLTMKIIVSLLGIFLLVSPITGTTVSDNLTGFKKQESASHGEIIALSCSDPFPTLGQPVHLVITLRGTSGTRYNETVIVTDEFSGFVMTAGNMKWISGTLIISEITMTIGNLPRYTKKIPWYPSVVGNHTFHVTAGTSPEKQLNVSVGFDVEGIITPALGCPTIIIKANTTQLPITLSEERAITEELAQISQVTLHTTDGSNSYALSTPSSSWSTWVTTGTGIVEDDLIVSYDVDAIPEGFYNLSIRTTKNNYSWPHAIKICNTQPAEYPVVQLSDIHIGKYSNIVNKKKELIRIFTYLNEHVHPAFVILSGDSVDWYNQRCKRNVYLDIQEAILTSASPVFTIPGNHERYANSLLFLYFPFINLTPYHRYLNPLSDYSIQYGNMNFVFLDSGYEYSRWEVQPKIWAQTPEGSGLTNTQMWMLETIWGNQQMNQVIIMHHPAVNDVNDTGFGALPNDLPSGNNECIALNRGAFITYCIANNVSLVLTGHTHENHVFTALGKETENYSAWPLFVQTDSATLKPRNNGGRIIQIKNSTILNYDFHSFP